MATLMKTAKISTLLERPRPTSKSAAPSSSEACTVAAKRTSLLVSVARTGTFRPPWTALNSIAAS